MPASTARDAGRRRRVRQAAAPDPDASPAAATPGPTVPETALPAPSLPGAPPAGAGTPDAPAGGAAAPSGEPVGRARARDGVPSCPSEPAALPTEDAQAARHASARAGRASAVLEDYVELIDDLLADGGEARPTDIARRLGVSHPTAVKSIARLKALGLAVSRPYRAVFLTEEGHALANRVRARHRVVVDLLRAVGVPPDIAEADAEGLEHHVSDATLEAFARFLECRR